VGKYIYAYVYERVAALNNVEICKSSSLTLLAEDGDDVRCDDVVVVVTVGNGDCIRRKVSHKESELSIIAELSDSCDVSEDVSAQELRRCRLLLPIKPTCCCCCCMSSLSESSSSSDTRSCSLSRWCSSRTISSTAVMASLRSGDGINGEMASLRSHRTLFLARLFRNDCDDDDDEAVVAAWLRLLSVLFCIIVFLLYERFLYLFLNRCCSQK